MDIIEKIGDTITEKGKVAADKAKELAAIANLKSQDFHLRRSDEEELSGDRQDLF